MSDLFMRKARVIIDDLLIEDLRIAFRISKSLKKEPNTGEVIIYNLSEKTRNKIQKKDVSIIVEAGYPKTIAQICKMDVRQVVHVRAGADWTTKITAGDGEVAYRNVFVSKSYSKNAKVETVAKELAQALGLDMGNVAKRLGKGGFKNGITNFLKGYVVHGVAADELTRVLETAGLSWSIQDGRLQILAENEFNDQDVVVLDASSGLIGSPEVSTTGAADGKKQKSFLKIKSLLQPALMPGRRISLNAERLKGMTKVEKVTHIGDTHAQDFYSDIEASII